MQTENTVKMAGDLDTIVSLAADTERWPIILPHYRWVKRLDGEGDHKTVEMAARRGRIPVKWRAVQEVERSSDAPPIIHFRHIWGVTKGMQVAWTFTQEPDAVTVRISHDWAPNWPVIGKPASEYIIGPQFVEAIASETLKTIKGIVEGRDRRFDTNGKPRT